MVAVEKYIRKLLYEQDCVIIPELGGLLTHHINAQYNSASGMFSPSQKRVAFNEVLKLDDGLLTFYISVNEKISREEAMSCVKKYTETLRASLREEGKAAIPGVGDFRNNSEGKLVFEPDSTQNFNVDWFGFQSIKAVELKANASSYVEEPVLHPAPVFEAIAATEVETEEEEMTEEEVTTRKTRWGWSGWAAAAAAAGMAFYLSVFYAPSGTNSMLSTLNPFYGVSEYVQTTMAEKQIAESKDDLTIEIEDDLVIAPEETLVADEQQATVPAQPVSAKVAIAEPQKVADLAPKAASPVVTPVDNVVKKFYVIAGSFESMKNAQILLTQLQQGGFANAFIMEQKGNGLIKVSAQGYDSMNEAYNNLEAVEKVAGEGVWVYKNRL
ncbi:SPOR domain-containing protein [Telluribacter sp. SYSU D00476]|uniref:HU domain-containing protein n=1 Tax=Telluribacter sp. SYSU D00476 TaxID=2811430 RepID=UPI001FF3CACC|nr:SPOR domain-containing protein [Telluribacter sp. SYSU D00476]